MRKFLTSALVAATAAGAIAATAAPAEAQSRYYYSRHHHHSSGDTVAAAAVAGIAGLALGAALSSHDGRSSGGYYSSGRGYYSNGYSYDPRYDSYYGGYYARPDYPRDRVCITQERVWDPYIGRHVYVERRYPC